MLQSSIGTCGAGLASGLGSSSAAVCGASVFGTESESQLAGGLGAAGRGGGPILACDLRSFSLRGGAAGLTAKGRGGAVLG